MANTVSKQAITTLLCLLCICSARALLPTDRSFSLRSSIHSIKKDGSSRVIYLRESYSREQNRAALHYQAVLRDREDDVIYKSPTDGQPLAEPEKTHSVYLDLAGLKRKSTSLILVDRQIVDCSLITLPHLNYRLNLENYLPADEKLADPLIVGAARLLFFSRNQLKESEQDSKLFVRNIPSVAYELEYRSEAKEDVRMLVIYAKNSINSDQQSFPIQIILSRPNGDSLLVDFGQVQLLSVGTIPSRQKDDVELDEFAVDPDFNCPRVLLAEGRETMLFAGAKDDRVKFTFTATSQYNPVFEANKGEREMFAAYDARADSLRVDFWRPQRSHLGRQVQMFNFALNLRYDINVGEFDRVTGKLVDAEGKDASASTQCLTGRIRSVQDGDYSNTKRLSLGKLLFGADQFIYLGRARVRGLDARMYEAREDVVMPFWIDQPTPIRFRDKRDEFERSDKRFLDKPVDASVRRLITVLYVADQPSTDLPIPLKFDILEANQKGTKVYSRQFVSIYSFAWHLGADGPFGERASELFSLTDMCAAGLGANLFARVHLLLEAEGQSADKQAPEEPPTALERNSALVGALQRELRLQANLVFDLQSRLRANNVMEVSFRVAEHQSSFLQPIYLGQGRSNLRYPGYTFSTKKRYFHECLVLAASERSCIYFGFDPLVHLCRLDMGSFASHSSDVHQPPTSADTNEPDWPASYDPDEENSMEVYKINYVPDESQARAKNWIIENGRRVANPEFQGQRLHLIDYHGKEDSELIIKRSHVDKRDLRSPLKGKSEADQLQSMDATTADRLVGYTFVDGAQGNRMVSAEHLATDKWTSVKSNESQMSFDKCQAACLSDFDCQSFSVCVRAGQFECILSRTNFRSLDLVEQLQQALEKSPKSDRLQLNVDSQQVELLRKRLCTIHIKRYLEMFEEPTMVSELFSSRLARQVSSREECAQLCVKRTLDTLRNDIAEAGKLLTLSSHNVAAKDVLELADAVAKHRESAARTCNSFFYLDRANVDLTIETYLRTRLTNPEMDSQLVDGYCVLGERPSDEELQVTHNSPLSPDRPSQFIDCQVSKFKTDLLYERQFGVYLASSKMTRTEAQAYRLLLNGREAELTEEQMSAMRKFVAEGRNAKEITFDRADLCADLCIAQTWGPWPACRSFDVVIRMNADDSRSLGCYLNSVTLAQAVASGRSELIKSDRIISGEDVQVWHYEPRTGLTLETSLLSANLELVEDSLTLSSIVSKSSSYAIHFLATLVFALFGTVSGVLIAIQFGPKAIELITPVGTRRQSADREQVVGALQEFEFAEHASRESTVIND